MNVWEFASSTLWPMVVLIAVLTLRRPLSELVRNIRHASLPGGVEFDVGKLEEATAEAVAAQSPPLPGELPMAQAAATDHAAAVTSDVAALAALSPAAVVMNSWRAIETALRRLYGIAHDDESPEEVHRRSWPGPMAMIATLRQQQYLSEPTFVLLKELRRLRNAVAHEDEEPHVGAALAYAESADTAVQLLDLTTAAIEDSS